MSRQHSALVMVAFCAIATSSAAALEFLDDRFEMPDGFHIYRAAGPELTGGSYDLAFDGAGRLLVGDGTAVRRLLDRDENGLFDGFETIATGLGWRGPQGLLVYGDRLYAVGGDGIQVFEGYQSRRPLHYLGRIGNKFNTGGDHDAHTIFRGFDGYIYLMSGNGAGNEDRRHITETSSPVLFEREACVFRISPDGTQWECMGAGGRNPPNLGMNYLGELFSLDSDMEWHVGLPWYRPVTLNHWVIGGDQGWQEVGAYPRYYLDSLPGLLEIGRGSPNWGVFYEHRQLPEKFRDAFLVCDYRWKRASNDEYATTGRLLAFFLKRDGASWKASMEILACPKPNARDGSGKLINFALVDLEVAPDGSLFVSDHNQGIWRIFYDSETRSRPKTAPSFAVRWPDLPKESNSATAEVLSLPQPIAEWSRLREGVLRGALGSFWSQKLEPAALNTDLPLAQRLRAVRMLSSDFAKLSNEFVDRLARADSPELRGQAAWLLGVRRNVPAVPLLTKLLEDQDAFVRRRAAEALGRLGSPGAHSNLVARLADSDRLVRYTAMTALAHRPSSEWMESALSSTNAQTRMRALIAGSIRREAPNPHQVQNVIRGVLEVSNLNREDRLDLLRIVGLFQKTVETTDLKERVGEFLLSAFADPTAEIRWEQIRLLGNYRVSAGFGRLLNLLEAEKDQVTQFHIAQALCRIPGGWTDGEESRLLRWFFETQKGWFAEVNSKGVEFPHFWATVLSELGSRHGAALLRERERINYESQLGTVAIELLLQQANPAETLLALYNGNQSIDARIKFARALQRVPTAVVETFLHAEYQRADQPMLRAALLQSLCVLYAQRPKPAHLPFLLEGLGAREGDLVATCSGALETLRPALDEPLARVLLSRMSERGDRVQPLNRTLAVLSQTERPAWLSDLDRKNRVEPATRTAALDFWSQWYEKRFQQRFQPLGAAPKTNEELHRFLLTDAAQGGRASRGARVYERLQCNNCHGGGVTPGQEGRLFGPDLAGATRRLPRVELADALVYPSKQVADRFKAVEVVLKNGVSFTGFLTEQSEEAIVLADREQVRRVPRRDLQTVRPQSNSLMPDQLLNVLDWEEIRDLMAFLDGLGGAL